jgi:hypothetical protein
MRAAGAARPSTLPRDTSTSSSSNDGDGLAFHGLLQIAVLGDDAPTRLDLPDFANDKFIAN